MDWIEKLAREHGTGGWQTLGDMVRFGKAVAEEEREACAKVCDELGNATKLIYRGQAANDCAAAIRSRSKT